VASPLLANNYRELSPAAFQFHSELMDGAPPDTWDPAAIRRLYSRPMNAWPERHRIAMDEYIVARCVETRGSEDHARHCLAMGKRIIAAHEKEDVENLIAEYEDEKFDN
jgi:hypothetical protein